MEEGGGALGPQTVVAGFQSVLAVRVVPSLMLVLVVMNRLVKSARFL